MAQAYDEGFYSAYSFLGPKPSKPIVELTRSRSKLFPRAVLPSKKAESASWNKVALKVGSRSTRAVTVSLNNLVNGIINSSSLFERFAFCRSHLFSSTCWVTSLVLRLLIELIKSPPNMFCNKGIRALQSISQLIRNILFTLHIQIRGKGITQSDRQITSPA
jgi:hypothetical protein